MESKYKRISRIENFFSMLLTKWKVSDNIYVGTLPPTTKEEWNDMVLIDVNKQTDLDAYSTGSATIYLYARPTGSGPTKNVKQLNAMEIALDDAIKNGDNENYSIDVNWRDSDYDDDRNFHYNVVNVNVIVR